MPREPRTFAEGIYHLAAHASDTRHLFLDDEDRVTFLERLALVVGRFDLRPVAYALLGNHYHLVVGTPGGGISRALQQLHTWYARRHNWRTRRRAHLFRAHFFARDLEGDDDLLNACRYVAHNPVAAGLCLDPFEWRWSSTPATAGVADAALELDDGPLRCALGDSDDWRDRYRRFIADGGSD